MPPFILVPLKFSVANTPISSAYYYFRGPNMEVLQHRLGFTQRIHEGDIGRFYPQSRLSEILLGSETVPLEDYGSAAPENTPHYFGYIPGR